MKLVTSTRIGCCARAEATNARAAGSSSAARFGAGEITRENFLGFIKLNPRCWPEVPWHRIGIGAPQDEHAWIRPLLAALLGGEPSWSPEWCAAQAKAFFAGRRAIAVPNDLSIFATRVLHVVHVGLELTEKEAAHFNELKVREQS